MAQLSLYLPNDLVAKLRQESKRARESLSAHVTRLLRGEPAASQWPKSFRDVLGSWKGEFPEPVDPPPQDVRLDRR